MNRRDASMYVIGRGKFDPRANRVIRIIWMRDRVTGDQAEPAIGYVTQVQLGEPHFDHHKRPWRAFTIGKKTFRSFNATELVPCDSSKDKTGHCFQSMAHGIDAVWQRHVSRPSK